MNDPFDFHAQYLDPDVQRRVREYLDTHDTRPLHVDLDLTTACNYRCPHCGDLARSQLNRGGLDADTLHELVEDFETLGVRQVSLIGGGEPMASPHFVEVVRALHGRGIRVGVVTNGCLIDRAIASEIAGHCAWVRISLDAATAATYDAVHRPPPGITIHTVLENLTALVEGMPGRVGLSYLVTNRTVCEMAAAAALARERGCSYIRFRPVQHPLSGAVLPVRDRAELARQLAACRTLANDRFIVSEGDAFDPSGETTYGGFAQPKCYTRCHAQAFGTVITGTGSVYVCSKWRGDEDNEIGNVNETRLVHIWHGRRRRDVLARLDPSRKCARVFCQAHVYNEALHRALSPQAVCVAGCGR